MSFLQARCLFGPGTWDFDFIPESFHELTIHIGFDIQEFTNLSFGYAFDQVEKQWPSNGEVYIRSDQPFVHSEINYLTKGFAVVSFFAQNDGQRVVAQFDAALPRPPRPFESWTYADGVWVPPVPCPDDASMHWEWDEDSLMWVGHARPETPFFEVMG